MYRFSFQNVFLVLTMLFVFLPAASYAADVYSPGKGVICDKVGQTCFDSYGASIGITKDELGQAAADKLENNIKEAGNYWDPTIFKLSNGVTCDTKAKTCKELSGKSDSSMTKTLFGKAAVKDTDSHEMKAEVDGHCKLYNTKSDNNKYKGNCTIKQKMSDDSNKFVITLGNGDVYKFIEQSNGYQVKTPEGTSKNVATMTDHGNKAVFKWGKWELTAKEN